ncbi:hypothetical protein FACS1894199_09290 [Bacteroidia bacterium]|nr:hypothetical protein FACS1894199_09290 [Bacteroidia bacterium]
MKKNIYTTIIAAMFLLPSCADYLDVVPDNVVTLEDIFSRKSEAWNALAKVYSYMPQDDRVNLTSWTLGDDYQVFENNTNATFCYAPLVMQGQQITSEPLLGNWTGAGAGITGGKPLYQGIRVCNIFLQHIDGVGDMSDTEKKQWAAQAKFMKAYYHFLLLQKYGPIIISDKIVSAEARGDEMFPKRSKVEDCFNYIIRLLDEAIPYLELKTSTTTLGQVDQLAATAIKARVLFFRASPFFNGNKDFYEGFLDHDGEPFFPMTENPEKWKEAIDAVDAAIKLCLDKGLDLYTYDKSPYSYDVEDYAISKTLQKYYNVRMVVTDPWNKEIIWGLSNLNPLEVGDLATVAQIRALNGYELAGGASNSNSFAWNWLAASYQVAERYYTRNGLPIDEDLTFDMSSVHSWVTTPGPTTDSLGYENIRGLLQPQTRTIQFHLNREPRFYANLGISGGYWRSHINRMAVTFYPNSTEGWGASRGNDYLCTGIGTQKFVHPESKSGLWSFVIRAPYPIIRLADLYLMKAEALNEYEGPSQKVYDALNKIRQRAGIPDVEVVWADPALTKHPNKHLDKSGLRDIILRERGIELAFEGIRYWDMVRHRRAHTEFNTPIMGWSVREVPSNFFMLRPIQANRFSSRDYLWPIDLDEMNTNSNLIQNPGW